jgi:hypothetical protein
MFDPEFDDIDLVLEFTECKDKIKKLEEVSGYTIDELIVVFQNGTIKKKEESTQG